VFETARSRTSLAHAGEHMEQEPTAYRRHIDAFGQRPQGNSTTAEIVGDGDQVMQAASKAIEPPDATLIPQPGQIEQLGEFRSSGAGARYRLDGNPLAPASRTPARPRMRGSVEDSRSTRLLPASVAPVLISNGFCTVGPHLTTRVIITAKRTDSVNVGGKAICQWGVSRLS
jgi:hypothetical protein